MAGLKDPLSFGMPDDDVLEDLTAQLDRTLDAGHAPHTHQLGGDLLGDSDLLGPDPSNPFLTSTSAAAHSGAAAGSAAAAAHDPFASYGSLAPQQPHPPPPAYGAVATAGRLHESDPLAASPTALLGGEDNLLGASPTARQAPGLPSWAHDAAAPSAAPAPPSFPSSHDGTPEPNGLPGPSGSAAVSAAAQHAPLVVRVSDPQKRDSAGLLGMRGTHIEYTVHTAVRAQLEGWALAPGGEATVRRRFRDFVALSDVLKARYRGFFVPPRPEKNVVEGQRQSNQFIEERRLALEGYANKLAQHPAIGAGEELRMFLTTEGDLAASFQWQALQPQAASAIEATAKLSKQLIGRESKVVDPVEAAQPAARSGDLLRAMREQAHGFRTKGGATEGGGSDEGDLRHAREVMEEMREQLTATSRAAEKLVMAMDRASAAHGDLGLCLFKCAKFEEAAGGPLAQATGTLRNSAALIADNKRAAAALVRLSKMLLKATGRTAQELRPLHDHLALMPAVLRGLLSREHQLLTRATLEADLEARKAALQQLEVAGSKVFGGDAAKVRRSDELRADVCRLDLSIGAAAAEYAKIAAANRSELARFQGERRAEYSALLESFAATQVAASERVLEVWVQLAQELGAGPEQLARVRALAPSGALHTAAQ